MFLEITPQWLEAISQIAWPVIIVFLIIMLWPHTYRIIKEATDFKIKVGDYELSASRQTAEILLKPIIDELQEAVTKLNDEHKAEFRRIYHKIISEENKFILPPDFKRETPYHRVLQALRNVNFIRPIVGGKWDAGKEIEIKNFGKIAAKLKAKALGFEN